ncbi:zf-TFIIB domain-containing protein [Variovorax sp. HJSM1_2]|uniref:TFIIB-type zinc ribbon-containing protein n=1 Tax=Variovorax sp. HJSM1_2 TaxID=3366263 RepID=UPI003BBBAD27
MKCPTCPDATLVMADRQGIEIDYCPQCRGVWLDRGELDKLIERSGAGAAPVQQAVQQPQYAQPQYQQQRRPDFDDSGYNKRQGYRKQKSWLSEIFD